MSAQTAFAQGDPEQGKVLGYTCLGCHGIEGYRNAYPSYRVPKLGGQKSDYIEAALTAYRDGNRPHPTMQAQGGSLSDQDIQNLAAYFSSFGDVSDTITTSEVAGNDAAAICVSCHGAAGAEVVPAPPTLAGQHQDYLERTLNQYKDGARSGNVMTAFAAGLSDADIRMLARLYAAQDGLNTPVAGR
jgi:cytochrome c553